MTKPLFLFAPGAGAPSSSAWMTAWAKRLETLGTVVRFDYPYMLQGRRAPDPQSKLIRSHVEALEDARRRHSGPVVLAGKSMGGRMGCHVSLVAPVSGLVCLGYPLKGAGARAAIRDAVLLELRSPVLFVQGTRDSLCPLDLMADVRARMATPNDLLVIDGGDHSLDVTAKELRESGRTQAEVNTQILARIAAFVDRLGAPPAVV